MLYNAVLTFLMRGIYGFLLGNISSIPRCHIGITMGTVFASAIRRPTPTNANSHQLFTFSPSCVSVHSQISHYMYITCKGGRIAQWSKLLSIKLRGLGFDPRPRHGKLKVFQPLHCTMYECLGYSILLSFLCVRFRPSVFP